MNKAIRMGLVLVGTLACTMNVEAKPRTAAQMEEAAKAALAQVTTSHRLLPANIKVTAAQTTDSYTVFTRSEGGFAIIAADDLVPAVLGVSADKRYNEGNENFNWWLKMVDEAVRYVVANNVTLAATPPEQLDFPEAVEPMITTEWDQGAPYNNYAPSTVSERCITGCVATAIAQVLNYHKSPVVGRGVRTITYPYRSKTGQKVTAEFEKHYYDWDHMLDKYNYGTYSDEEADAVAVLMRDCGVAVNMMYGTGSAGGSGAYSENAATGLRTYFGMVDAQCVYRDEYEEKDWMSLVYSELSNNRPLYYGGTSSGFGGGGHAFVIHGYNKEGKVYVNWGWSGDNDGYYDIALLNPSFYQFSSGQDMIIGVYPQPTELEEVEVTVNTPGQLKELVPDELIGIVGKLKVKGDINSTDLLQLRKLAGSDETGKRTAGWLQTLDLGEARIVAGGDEYFASSPVSSAAPYVTQDDVVGKYAFYNCRALRSLTLPKGVKHIAPSAFKDCFMLDELNIEGAADKDFVVKDGIIYNKDMTEIVYVSAGLRDSLTIADGVTALGTDAMRECEQLEYVMLPATIKTLGNESMAHCTHLKELRVASKSIPALGAFVFSNVFVMECDLYVRNGLKKKYAQANQWSDFIYEEYFDNIHEFGTTVKARNTIRKYGEPNPTLGYQMLGDFVQGKPELICEVDEKTPAGRYPITVKPGTITDPSVDYEDGFIIIQKATLTAQVNDATRARYENDPEFTITYTGFKNDDDASVIDVKPVVVSSALKDSPEGVYELTASGGEDDCYDFEYVSGKLTIDGVTGIEGLEADGAQLVIHRLDGTLVSATSLRSLQKGVYIVNGRKVVVQ